MNAILWPLVAAYLVVLIGIGVWSARKRVATYEDMTVAGRGVGPFLIACSVAATWINGVTLITVTGFGKSFGLSGYWHMGAVGIGTLWAGIYLVPRMWKLQVITTPQILERFFGPTHRLAALVVAMLRDFAATAGTIGATAIVASAALGISIFEALVLTYFVTVLYVTLGGMWAVLVTDTIQFFIIVLGTVLLLVFSIQGAGGFGGIFQKVDDPTLFSPTGDFEALEIMGWFSVAFFLSSGYQTLAQRAFAARSREAARRGFIYGGIFCVFWYITPALLGLTGIAFFGKEVEADQVFINLTNEVAGPVLGSIIFVALMSANMSTLSSTIGTMGSNVTVDIYQRFIDPNAGSRRMLWISRASILLTAVLACVTYYYIPFLMELFLIGGRIVGGSLAPVLIAILLFPSMRRRGRTVLASLTSSAGAVILCQLLSPRELKAGTSFFVWGFMDPVLVGVLVSLVVLVVGSRWEGRKRPRFPASGQKPGPTE
ncbi:MAG: sodium:solute symporter family protein [Acidobacteriota bacterium]|nr:sodium:solute symporter family protein [Acidobacteriota bacterium]